MHFPYKVSISEELADYGIDSAAAYRANVLSKYIQKMEHLVFYRLLLGEYTINVCRNALKRPELCSDHPCHACVTREGLNFLSWQ